MKRLFCSSIFWVLMVVSTTASGASIDLTSFTFDPGVVRNKNSATFSEDFDYSAIYLFNDDFIVRQDAAVFSFNYDFQLGQYDFGDYFTFEVNFDPVLEINADVAEGYFEFDLSPYAGHSISLAWGLLWDGDDDAGTVASIYNVDFSSPVPEPGSILLLGVGLISAATLSRKRLKKVRR